VNKLPSTLLRLFFLILFYMAICFSQAQAQMGNSQIVDDSLKTAVLPIASYSSNKGFVAGAIYSRYDYLGNTDPFNDFVEASVLVSTKGYIRVKGKYEKTRSFGRNIRTKISGYVNRYNTDVFFGVGNDVPFLRSQWKNDYYFFRSVSFGLKYQLRKPIYESEKSHFDLKAGLSSSYHIPYIKKQQSSFAQLMPNGSSGGWVNNILTGFVWENRDSEFDPHHGNRAELEIRYAPDIISSYALGTARLDLRQYFQLFNWLTIANKLEARHARGDLPYWERPTLGDKYTLRGYPLNRFKGNSLLTYSLELRGWIFQFRDFYGMKLGGHLFTDVGRVFTRQDEAKDLFRDYKQTVGFGGEMSIFNPDFILRGEIGFSDDTSRIYIGIGYSF